MTEAFVDRRAHRLAAIELLANALEDQHVRVDRDTDREHEAGETGQREHRVEAGERGERVQHVQRETADREQLRRSGSSTSMITTTSATAMAPARNALVDRVLTEARTDAVNFRDAKRHGKRAGAQHEREILRVARGRFPAPS